MHPNLLFFILLCFKFTMVINQCLGVDHDGILLLFSPFPIIPIVGKGGLPQAMQIMVALRVFSSAGVQLDVSDTFGISKDTVCRTVHRVANVLAGALNRYEKFERQADAEVTKAKFYAMAVSSPTSSGASIAHTYGSVVLTKTSTNMWIEKEYTQSTCSWSAILTCLSWMRKWETACQTLIQASNLNDCIRGSNFIHVWLH